MELMWLLAAMLPLVVCVESDESRFIISPTNHSLHIITNLGAIRSVEELLMHEPWVLRGYGLDFELESDRSAVYEIMRRHAAGEPYLEGAAQFLPVSWDTCEAFTGLYHEIENDDGSLSYDTMCQECGTEYDVTHLFIDELPPDIASGKESMDTQDLSDSDVEWQEAIESGHAKGLDFLFTEWGGE